MHWVDFAGLGIAAAVVVLQMFRVKISFSMVVYEAFFLAAAAFGADKLLPLLRQSVAASEALLYIGTFMILGGLGIIVATLIDKVFEFDGGKARYVLAFLPALVCGIVLAHVVLKEVVIAAGPRAADLSEAVARSLTGTQLVHGKFLGRLIPGLIRAE